MHTDLLRFIRSMKAKGAAENLSDQQLLEMFLNQHSEASFTALVQRHGAMVFGVCRRLLRQPQDAEDAFQAVFLTLARQVASIRQHEALGSWLHGVAYRIAWKMKRAATRRAVHEGRLPPPSPGDAMDDITWRELRAVLDEELHRLPEQYRAPLVLCYLESRTQDEAARQLGWSKSTFGRRMSRARDLLAQRLTRRGLTLSAALTAPVLFDSAAMATVPPLLVASTVRASLAAALGQATEALVSAQVAALAEVGVASLLAKKGSIAVVLLVSLTLGFGGFLAHRAVQDRTLAEAPAAPKAAPTAPPSRPARSASKDKAIEIKGRVLDPDGKPVAGAPLILISDTSGKKADATVRATSDKEGRFRFTAKPADYDSKGKATLAVTANGFGPDWVEVTTKNKDAITLHPVKDDVPIEGRILDLEGKPVAGVTVRVLNLHQTDLDWWLKEEKRGRVYYPKSIEPAALGAPGRAITGKDGRFQLHGLGRERLVYLLIEGDTIERVHCWGLTRDGKNLNLAKRGEPIYPAKFDHIAAPTKPILGTVRDKDTGKPLPGIIVLTERRQTGRWIDEATTDERGRYRIVGNPKQREYAVSAVGRPYFAMTKSNLADTPGLEPLVVDFALERGIEITGRILNKATGKPVGATITYHALADNPYLKKGSDLNHGFASDGRNRTEEDGSFFTIGLPGPGYLTVLAWEDDYRKPERPADWEKVVPYVNLAPPLVHAWTRINPSEKDPKSMHYDIALEPAKPIPGQVLDPEGKPLGGYFAAGLTGSPLTLSYQLNLHEQSSFRVRGFDPGRPRTVLFIHPEKKLGKVIIVRENQRDSLQVRLEPLGAVTGRILDAEGRPRVGLQVHAPINEKQPNLVRTLFLFEIGLKQHHLDPLARTDADGKFRLDALMPGLKYTLLVGEEESKPGTRIVKDLTVESGKIKDFGDLKIR
jgi:RNA polymerase sigma factor (sigma-70 family)